MLATASKITDTNYMNLWIVSIIGEIIILYVLTRHLTQNLYIAAFLLTKSRPVSVGFLSLIFFPGTVIHELSHLFTAEILGVHTGGLTLVPEGIEQTSVRTGSVSIAQTDPLRRAAIGVAPVFVGMATLFTISYFLPGLWNQTAIDFQNGIVFSQYSLYALLLSFYALFAVSNSMFSSPEDMEGFWPVAIVVVLVFGAAYIAGIKFSLPESAILGISNFVQSLATNLGGAVALNITLFGLSHLAIFAVEKMTGRTFIRKS